MDIITVRGIVLVVLFVSFLGLWFWAWSDKRKKGFAEAANLPLEDDQAIDQPRENH